ERALPQIARVVHAAVAGRVQLGDIQGARAAGASASHESHRPHGSAVGPCTQLSDRARMRADEVLPQPRGPEKRYAWLMRPEDNATESGSVTCSWPTTSAKEAG